MIHFAFVFLFLATSPGTSAQPGSCGVYFTASDFQAHKLSQVSPCLHNRNAIRFRERPFLTVLHDGRKYKYKKQDVFGFKDCSGNEYRIYRNEKYQVLSRENIFLYEVDEEVGFSEMVLYQPSYFFSETIDSPIYPLTKHYLDWVFTTNPSFVKLISASFKNDADLIVRDENKKEYKLISCFLQSLHR